MNLFNVRSLRVVLAGRVAVVLTAFILGAAGLALCAPPIVLGNGSPPRASNASYSHPV